MIYRNERAAHIAFPGLQFRILDFRAADELQPSIPPLCSVDLSDETRKDKNVQAAIRLGYLKPLPMKHRTRVPWCPYDGVHGMANGAAPAVPRPNCPHCNAAGLTNFNHYCPTCYVCLDCDRIIKRKWKRV